MLPLLASSWSPTPEGESDEPRRVLGLRHTLRHARPGLWGDDPIRPSSVLLLRPGDGTVLEAFGDGRPEPAVSWLAGRRDGPIALLAPRSWEPLVRSRFGPARRGTIVTLRIERELSSRPLAPRPNPAVRRLTAGDEPLFRASTPDWSLRSWGSFGAMLSHGAAFGVPASDGLAAAAWVLEEDGRSDGLGVFVAPRFRRLGLGRAVAGALAAFSTEHRGRQPLWSLANDNAASRALAASLGFGDPVEEVLLRL